jgi:hypothetical protein
MYQSGTAGCGWHSPVQTFRDQFGSQAAELIGDVPIAAAASGMDAAAIVAARWRTNLVIAGLPVNSTPKFRLRSA